MNVVAALTADGVGTCGADDNQAQAGHLVASIDLQNTRVGGDVAGAPDTTRPARGGGQAVMVAHGGNNIAGPIDVAAAVNAHGGPHGRMDFESETFVCAAITRSPYADNEAQESRLVVTHALRADGFDASEDGTGRGTPLTVVPFDTTQLTSAANRSAPKPGDSCHPLAAGAHAPAVAVAMRGRDGETQIELNDSGCANALRTPSGGRSGEGIGAVLTRSAVRRLTPTECERLQGFPDGHTAILVNGKPAADGPRYRALGNSMAVPVMLWIGERIALIEELMRGGEA